jgi:hypothetical protein
MVASRAAHHNNKPPTTTTAPSPASRQPFLDRKPAASCSQNLWLRFDAVLRSKKHRRASHVVIVFIHHHHHHHLSSSPILGPKHHDHLISAGPSIIPKHPPSSSHHLPKTQLTHLRSSAALQTFNSAHSNNSFCRRQARRQPARGLFSIQTCSAPAVCRGKALRPCWSSAATPCSHPW